VDRDPVIVSFDRGNEVVIRRLKVHVDFDALGHVAARTVGADRFGQPGLLATVGRRVAFPTGVANQTRVAVARRIMRVMAGDARQRIAFQIALALFQVGDLIGDVVVLGVRGRHEAIVVLQRLAGAILHGRSAEVDGVAVALRADLGLAIA